MGTDQVIALGRGMLIEVALLVAPLLMIAVAVSFVVSVFQVLTSLQDQTLSAVPRLLSTGVALFVLMPWMWRHLAFYTLRLFSDFHGVLQ
ncbi:MAG TPA: flagellar biosynthetic protein FliQ [Acidobacteriaceae bacterium]|jgi:flagellar biosynthetic protein FliQ